VFTLTGTFIIGEWTTINLDSQFLMFLTAVRPALCMKKLSLTVVRGFSLMIHSVSRLWTLFAMETMQILQELWIFQRETTEERILDSTRLAASAIFRSLFGATITSCTT